MDPEIQDRIAYWIDGYAQSEQEARVGPIARDGFWQPIGELSVDREPLRKRRAGRS
jgi:hypothetical protein